MDATDLPTWQDGAVLSTVHHMPPAHVERMRREHPELHAEVMAIERRVNAASAARQAEISRDYDTPGGRFYRGPTTARDDSRFSNVVPLHSDDGAPIGVRAAGRALMARRGA